MKYKHIIFDVDWVIINTPTLFTSYYEVNKWLEKWTMLEFFLNDFKQCTIWISDLKESVSKYLGKWKWEWNCDEFLKYWFEYDSKLDKNILNFIDKLNSTSIKCYIATNQEKYRADYILNGLWLNTYFNKSFISSNMWLAKPNPLFFEEILNSLNIKPEEILFIDDSSKNILAAEKVWIKWFLYKDYESFIKDFNEINEN